MKIKIILLTIFIGTASLLFGQYTTVSFDLERNYFNEGQVLPAEKPLMFTGQLPEGVDLVEIQIFPGKSDKLKDRLYFASWKDYDNAQNSSFSLAVNYRLRASEKYDFYLDFFENLDQAEAGKLAGQISLLLNAYLEANLNLEDDQIKLAKSTKKMIEEMNDIIKSVMSEYRSRDDTGVKELSETVRLMLEKAAAVRFEKLPADSTRIIADAAREDRLQDEISDIRNSIDLEIEQLLGKNWSRLAFSRMVDDYETEEKRGSLSINVGYGGVYLSGNVDQFSYGASPYLGLSLPLSNSTLAPKFFRNASITMGVFLQNFEDADGNTVSGVLVNRPLYLGLDYKLFEFVRLNAGAAFLETTALFPVDGGDPEERTNLFVRPFIGLSARIDLSIQFGK
ncbi:MAG: hypothetical protein KDC34_08935 [Saprospiraceae bacterium]|nr:hypothetical protein [Saprospiraceae bacterium]